MNEIEIAKIGLYKKQIVNDDKFVRKLNNIARHSPQKRTGQAFSLPLSADRPESKIINNRSPISPSADGSGMTENMEL